MAARRKPWRVPDRLWVEVEPLIPRRERRFRSPGRKRPGDHGQAVPMTPCRLRWPRDSDFRC